jgi:hypothetical protein
MFKFLFISFIYLISVICELDTNDVNVFAHNFNTDDNSSFLTVINKILIENRLVNDSLSNDIVNPYQYTKNLEKILEDVLISESSFKVDSDQFYNNTIIALVIANLADEVLRNYGHAFGVPSNVMLSMNFSKVINTNNASGAISNKMSGHIGHRSGDINNSLTLMNQASYLTALLTSDRMLEIYNSELKDSVADSPFGVAAKLDLVHALFNLKNDIQVKASPYKVMADVHGSIHPNLQVAYDLTLKR